MDILIICFLLTVSFIAFYFISKEFEVNKKVKKRIESFVHSQDIEPDKDDEGEIVKKPITVKIGDSFNRIKVRLRNYYSSIVPTPKEEQLQKKLLQAGNPFGMTVADYYIMKNILRIDIPLLFGVYAVFRNYSFLKIIFFVGIGLLLSVKLLDIYIELKRSQRYKRALIELPDFLDILTISVEAGLGFDIALSRTIEKREGILCSEFNTCLEEIRLGKTRKDALTGVKERLAFDEVISFINSILQSERLGVGIVQTLRAKSEDERDKRKQRAQEIAMKSSIKILFPLVFLIFPSIFIVVFGPAVLRIAKSFSGF